MGLEIYTSPGALDGPGPIFRALRTLDVRVLIQYAWKSQPGRDERARWHGDDTVHNNTFSMPLRGKEDGRAEAIAVHLHEKL